MGDLIYLVIFLVVINIVGRILRVLQKGVGQRQTPTVKSQPQPEKKSVNIFDVLEEQLGKLGETERQAPSQGEPPPHPYTDAEFGATAPEAPATEKPAAFARETSATAEAEFESIRPEKLHETTFPWQDTRYEYRPAVHPVTPAPRPEMHSDRSYRSDVVAMLRHVESVRGAVLLSTILGPCRARRGRYRSRGPGQ